eukprot:1162115-Pelagomonas_calceolata.AAC.2
MERTKYADRKKCADRYLVECVVSCLPLQDVQACRPQGVHPNLGWPSSSAAEGNRLHFNPSLIQA